MVFEDKLFLLKQILSKDDLINEGRNVLSLKNEFEDQILKFESEQQIKKLKAQEQGIDYQEESVEDIKEEFFLIFKEFNAKRKQQIELQNALETENYRQKKNLLKQLKELVENEEKINVAFNQLKIIQETWNKIGDIPRNHRDEIQKDFSRLMELFYYNINIYKELKEHDFKRNLQLKEKVIFKLKQLRNDSEELNELEASLRILQNEWEEIGPVQNEYWERIKENYWETVRGIYDKINSFYQEQKKERVQIIKDKEGLISNVKEINTTIGSIEKVKDWQKKQEEIIDIQKKWKTLGHGSKKENDRVWKEFRNECDEFFKQKKIFFEKLKTGYESVIHVKNELILEIRKIREKEDWENATNEIIKLQKKWKNTGYAGPKDENKLWKQFRDECDAFFNRKEKLNEIIKLESQEIIKNKLVFLNDLKSENNPIKKMAINDQIPNIYNLIRKFDEIGKLPQKESYKLNSEFKKVIKELFGESIGSENLEKICFQIDLISFKDPKDRLFFIRNEKSKYKKQQEKITLEINQIENNLGFFSNSKKSDNLLVEFENKIAKLKKQLIATESILKIIPNE